MGEELARLGDVEICFETFGSPDDPTMLLVMGLGTQMIAWPEEFCRRLADLGYHVIRYDNRDVGRSTHLRQHRPPTIRQLLVRDKRAAKYSLADMAGDGIRLLDHLGIERAHIVGASMGGMIAQTIAARYPERTLSLASIMSNTGHIWKGTPALRIYPIFLRRPAANREGAVESFMSVFKQIGSPEFPTSPEDMRMAAEASYERGYNPAGSSRQLAAIIAAGDRTAEVRTITAPTVVIHGTRDRLVRPSGGRATAAAIRGSKLVLIDGMGHDLPRQTWDRLIDAIVENARRADASDRSAAAA